MNIRSVSNPSLVMGKEKIEASKTIKSDETDEREANGQQPFSDPEPYRELTDEEAEQVLEKVKASESIQKSGLLVRLSVENGQKILRIEEPDGKLVKRFVERDLFHFFIEANEGPIRLVNKTA